MKTFRVSVAGGIDAVTDLAVSDGRHVLYMENLDVRSGKAVPYRLPSVNPNVVPPAGSVQVFAYRGRILFNLPGRRSYAAEFYDNRERIYWTQYGGNPEKMIDGTTVPLGTPRPASPVVSTGDAIAPQNIVLAISTTGGNLPAGESISFRLAYRTALGVFPASGSVVTTIPSTVLNAKITLSWSNPSTVVPVSEILVFVGDGTGDERFVAALGAKATTYEYPAAVAATGEAATLYDQGYAYQYCVTYLRDVNGVQNESGPSAPTPAFQSTLARKVVVDPWSEGLMDSDNLVTWGANHPPFHLLDVWHIPGAGGLSALTVLSIVQDPLTGQVIATFDGPHSFHDGERIYFAGCSPNPFANPNFTTAADTTARDAISPSDRVIGMLVKTTADGFTWQLQGDIENTDWVNVTGTPAASLPVEIQVADATVSGSEKFNQCVLMVPAGFVPPGENLSGVTAFRVVSVQLAKMDFNPQSGVLDLYTVAPHTFGTEKATFSGFTDSTWNDSIQVIGDPNNPLRLFVPNMSLPTDAVTGLSTCYAAKALTQVAYDLGTGSLLYSATETTQAGTNMAVDYATVTASGVTGPTGPQGAGINETIIYQGGSTTAACPILDDILYLTPTSTVKMPARVVGTPARGLLLNADVPGASGSGPAYTSGLQFVPYNDYISRRRIYRAGGSTNFQQVAELPLDEIEFLDAIPDAGMGQVLPTLYTQDDVDVVFEPAPFGLTGLTPHYKMLFAWDPSSNELRWTPEGQYDAWPPEFYQGFDYRILGLLSFNQALCVFCEDGIYRMDGSVSTGLVRHKTKAAGCRAGGSIQEIRNAAIYLGDEGIMSFSGQESVCLTDLKIPAEFWLATSRYLESSDPGQALVPFTQNAAFERLVGITLPGVTPPCLEPYRVDPKHYMQAQDALRSFVLFGRYYLYWGDDFPAYAAQTMVCIDFSAPGTPIGIIGLKAVDAFVDELNQVHMILPGIAAESGGTPAVVTSITLTPTAFALTTGEEATIMAIIVGNQTVTWSVDGIENGNATVGTITGNGDSVTYRAPASGGEHTITCASSVDGAISAVSTVSVTLASSVSIALSPSVVSLLAGAQTSLSAVVSGSSNAAVTWEVDGIVGGNATVGTIAAGTGGAAVYTAPAAPGSHTITAVSQADTSKSASAAVTVTSVPVVAISISPDSANLNEGAALSISATVTGSSNTAVTWAVDGVANGNSTVGVLSVNGNTVSYLAPASSGSHTITATSVADGTKSASCTVVVAAVALALSTSSLNLTQNTQANVTATITGTTNTGVNWTVDGVANGNSTVGTIIAGAGGRVTYAAPAAAGTHTIVATSAADATKTASCSVTVAAASTNVAISMTPSAPTALGAGGTLQFAASVTGSSNTAVTWAVNGIAGGNSTVGTIDSTGLYTAPTSSSKAFRSITATAQANPSAVATLRILTTQNNTVVNATTYGATGSDSSDDTSAINTAMGHVPSGGICLLPSGAYWINPKANSSSVGLDIPAGVTLLLAPGASLNSLQQSGSGTYNVVEMQNSDIALVGGVINGDRLLREAANDSLLAGDFEVGQGVGIANGGNMWLLGVTSQNNCCDGFYPHNTVTNVNMSDCKALNNRRNGMSPVSVTGLYAQFCNFDGNNGNPYNPGTGVDIEPNSGQTVSDVQFTECTFNNNNACGLAVGPSVSNGPVGNNTAHVTNIRLIRCKVNGNGAGASGNAAGGIRCVSSDSLSLQDCQIENNAWDGLWMVYGSTNGLVTASAITGNKGNGITLGGESSMANECGGTQVHGNTVVGNSGTQIYNASNSGATVGSNP